MRIELACRHCGSNDFRLDEAANDSALVACGECGRTFGTLGDIKEDVARTVMNAARKRP